MKLKLSASLIICGALIIASASAQTAPSGGGLDLSASVENPVPGQSVVITAQSFGIDINAATVTWQSGGKTLGKGVGLTKMTVQAPAIGKTVSVEATAVSSAGISVSASISLGSGSMDIIIEPGGYVPPFFRGKIPVPYQDSTKIIAVPHIANSAGVEYDPKSLVYTWRKGSSVLQEQSGYAAQSIVIEGGIVPRPYDISVTASTRDGAASTRGIISISASAPSVKFYRDDPLYGTLYNSAIGSTLFLGSEREAAVMAVPFGFKLPASGTEGLSFSWLINGIKRDELSANRSITLRAPDAKAGSSDVRLTLSGTTNILQQATAGLSAVWSTAK